MNRFLCCGGSDDSVVCDDSGNWDVYVIIMVHVIIVMVYVMIVVWYSVE